MERLNTIWNLANSFIYLPLPIRYILFIHYLPLISLTLRATLVSTDRRPARRVWHLSNQDTNRKFSRHHHTLHLSPYTLQYLVNHQRLHSHTGYSISITETNHTGSRLLIFFQTARWLVCNNTTSKSSIPTRSFYKSL